MHPTDFDEGDNFNSPFISGYEIVLGMICEDMDAFPNDYQSWEVKLLSDVCVGGNSQEWRDVMAYIDTWCERKFPDASEYEDCV